MHPLSNAGTGAHIDRRFSVDVSDGVAPASPWGYVVVDTGRIGTAPSFYDSDAIYAFRTAEPPDQGSIKSDDTPPHRTNALQSERNKPMNERETNTVAEATQTLAELLDLVQGFACESGTEALERYNRAPVDLMDRAAGILGKLKRLVDATESKKEKAARKAGVRSYPGIGHPPNLARRP